jgi:hypothetical protein
MAQDNSNITTYTGTLNRRHPSYTYTFDLQAGESVLLLAETTSGALDPNLKLNNPQDVLIGQNDNRSATSTDAVLGYTAENTGTYSVTVSRYNGQSNFGDYQLTITIGDKSVLDPLADLTAIDLSGPIKIIDTTHFRIHYTLRGSDKTTEDFASEIADTMEVVWSVEIDKMGWPAPPNDDFLGGDSRLDVYISDMLDSDGSGPLGATELGFVFGDNPNTPTHELTATSSTIFLENDFAEMADNDKNTPENLMRATAAHEFHHTIQAGMDGLEPFNWYWEATATWMETAVFPKNQAAVYYVDQNYLYPEICFGTREDPYRLLMYGDWMFIQSLVDQHGSKVVQKLWSNITLYDGWAALDHTLAEYGDTIAQALARYHVQNLLRDYKFGTYFGNAKVFLENDIQDTGRWTYSGSGIEELGANYYNLRLSDGEYNVSLIEDNNRLELWAIGVRGKEADAFHLNREGNISTSGYDHMYVMVFDPHYKTDLTDCSYDDYAIRVSATRDSALTPVDHTWNARYFSPPSP